MERFTGQLLLNDEVVAGPVEGWFRMKPRPGAKPTWYGELCIPLDATLDLSQVEYWLRLDDGRTGPIIMPGATAGREVPFQGAGPLA